MHIHSDFNFLSGADNMLIQILNSDQLAANFSFSLSYRKGEAYSNALEAKVRRSFVREPLALPNPEVFFGRLNNGKWWNLPIMAFLYFVAMPVSFLYEVLVLYVVLLKLKPEILHVNNGGYPGSISARAAIVSAKLAGVNNCLMVVNNLPVGKDSLIRKLEWTVNKYFLKRLTVVTASKEASRQLFDLYSHQQMKLRVIPNGVELPENLKDRKFVNAQGEPLIFVSVGLLESRKGHLIALRAAEELVARGYSPTDFKIIFEGHGPLAAELADYAKAAALDENVKFLGRAPSGVEVIASGHVLVHPSISHEDFPNVILESMALGLPAIGSRVGGISEQILDSETGVLIKPGDHLALADAMQMFIDRGDIVQEMGIAAQARFNRLFTVDRALQAYEDLYCEFLEERNSHDIY